MKLISLLLIWTSKCRDCKMLLRLLIGKEKMEAQVVRILISMMDSYTSLILLLQVLMAMLMQ